MVTQTVAVDTELLHRRAALAGPSGLKGLAQNARATSIAVFASLGGLVYGYNQGMFGQVLSMHAFSKASGTDGITNATLGGLVTAILELGAWIGVLANGYFADKLGRKLSVIGSCLIFGVGVAVQACTRDGNYHYILAGRFVTGIGVGGISILVPLYNAELAPPEIRGALVALQQVAITFGIMISYWLTYGTNFIGGTGDTQSNAAWLLPITLQLVPAFILAVGMLFMPQSPRWLMDHDREEECLEVLSSIRRKEKQNPLIQLEFLELKAQKLFERRLSLHDYPDLQDDSFKSKFKLQVAQYASLVSNPSNRKRTFVAIGIMVGQQWSGINFVLYYAPFIFKSLNLAGNATSLLASGVVGVVQFLATLPSVVYLDKWGRRPMFMLAAILMSLTLFSIAGIIAQFKPRWDADIRTPATNAAGWGAAVMVWLFAIFFSISLGGGPWVLVSEVFPLGLRAKGISVGASSNWLNNFAVAIATPKFVQVAPWGAYIFLGGCSVILALWVYFYVPETRGRSLEELDEVFADNSGRSKWEAEQLLQAQRDVGLLNVADIEPTTEKEHSSIDHELKEEKV
ncbi:general substrate transporter [Meira miltonrushii]|uniref:General substrate transporter n=1 Tax=Meira miltonrushii TaxID=1280837 RepID=A0A316V543_9BASI|nr:general substrate transporter [Meira miltonrushii]PWN32687.1 general substrate transporter [Meira miltonrushii]